MSKLEIDLNDSPEVLTAARNLLNTLLDGAPPAPVAGDTDVATPILVEDVPAPEKEATVVSGKAAPTVTVAPSVIDASKPQRVDHNGVPFDGMLCANAADPFYGSGAKQGQWKKKRGVSDTDYDAWYAEQLTLAAPAGDTAADTETAVDPAAAFGAPNTAPAEQAAPETAAPTDAGGLMGWISDKQAAGLLTQDDVGAAYVATGLELMSVFPPNDAATISRNCLTLYSHLVVKAGA